MTSLKSFAAIAAIFCLLILSHQAQAAQPEKEWTMLVYVNGNNSLDDYGPKDINEMEQVGSTDQVNVVVQWASLAAKTTKRLFIQKDSDKWNVTSPVVQELPQVDMGDYKNLADFIKWGAQNYPARHYFVDVWNHGTGWHKFSLDGSFHPWDISIDDLSHNSITTYQLGLAMDDASQAIGRKIDIYASDACLMGMIEIAHQMKNSVEYFVGSEEEEPGDGWPYDEILTRWNNLKAPAQAQDIAKIVTDSYTSSYTFGVTMAAYDLRQIDPLTTSLSNLRANFSSQSNAKSVLQSAIANAVKFTVSDYVDLGDFLVQLKTRLGSEETVNAVSSVQSELSKFVISNSATGRYKSAQGVAIWLPYDKDGYSQWQKTYSQLSFDVFSQWHLLIEQSL